MLLNTAALADDFVELRVSVPVQVLAANGARVSQAIAVSVLYRPSAGKHPFLILEHGRASEPGARQALGLASYPANARYFAGLGFVVLIPTRIGYGVSGGPDVEYTGECGDKHFAAGVTAAVLETAQIIDYAASLKFVDARHGLVLGESFGGVVAIAAAAARLPGLVAAVNIAGGDGGDSVLRPDEPCRPDRLAETFRSYGRTERLPTLWLYSANDRVWGSAYPGIWFSAFTAAGGNGRFVGLPADKNNGHYIFNRNPAAWHPAFERFIEPLKLADQRVKPRS